MCVKGLTLLWGHFDCAYKEMLVRFACYEVYRNFELQIIERTRLRPGDSKVRIQVTHERSSQESERLTASSKMIACADWARMERNNERGHRCLASDKQWAD